ncbi:MAG: hypothetical protein J6G98_02140 [Bacilli bacterium]|nr:hypothetical protein [Bacilli bacterium]
MGLFDKVKNLFTEEIDEEPVKRETRQNAKPSIEIMERPVERSVERPVIEKEEIKPVEEVKQTREEKFVIFNDDDFKDLERPKKEEIKKEVKKEEAKPVAYKGAVINTEPVKKREFKPSPIISPVYGVLNKNYEKEDIKLKKVTSSYSRPAAKNIDDVRNKAFGNLEDDIKDDILGKSLLLNDIEEVVEPDINIFEELDKYEELESTKEPEVVEKKPATVDEIFGKLNLKKEEILDELDEKKDAIIEEIDNKTNNIDFISKSNASNLDEAFEVDDNVYADNLLDDDSTKTDVELSKQLLDDEIETTKTDVELAKSLVEDDETVALARELEEQKKKLAEINNLMDENEKATKTKSKKKKEVIEDDLEESELFDILDSSYEKKDDE